MPKYELTEAEQAWLVQHRGGCTCPSGHPPCGACSNPVTEAEWEMIEEQRKEKEKPMTDPPRKFHAPLVSRSQFVPEDLEELTPGETITADTLNWDGYKTMPQSEYCQGEIGAEYYPQLSHVKGRFRRKPATPWYQQASGPEAAAHEGEWWEVEVKDPFFNDSGVTKTVWQWKFNEPYHNQYTWWDGPKGFSCTTAKRETVTPIRKVDDPHQGITEEKENMMQQTCRCRDAVNEPVPEGYRELEDGELIQEGDVKFDDPGNENYDLVEADGVGENYQPRGSHNYGRFRKISQSNQGEIMSNKLFETRHLVNGRNIADVSAEELYSLIMQREAQIKNLQEAKHQPAKLKKYIAELEQELVDLVKFVDENDAKAEPTAPAAE